MFSVFGCATAERGKDNKGGITQRQPPLTVKMQTPAKLALLM
jgi:hypothetical protein